MIAFKVVGHPEPAGSKNAYVHNGRARVVDANPKSRKWKDLVATTARGALLAGRVDAPVFRKDQPVEMVLVFHRLRPSYHLNSKGELNAAGRRTPFPVTKPDALKLARGVEDALTGIAYEDDAQIVDETICKQWSTWEGVEIVVLLCDRHVDPAVRQVEVHDAVTA